MNSVQTPSPELTPEVESKTGQYSVTLISLGLFSYCLYWLQQNESSQQMWLMLIGGFLGLALYHASFGFTTAWRNLIVNRRGRGLRAQMVMLAVAVCLFFPALSSAELFGEEVRGYIRPLGYSVLVGAFIFGIGMQLGNGCASGNLYHAGGGQLRAIPSMFGFMVGGLWATADYEWWTGLPQFAPVSVIEETGLIPAIMINLALFAGIALFTIWLEKRTHGEVEKDQPLSEIANWRRYLQGPWPFIWGALVLAILNFATLAMTGRPWAVAVAYPLWGAKLAMLLELELELDFWSYWLQPGRETALEESLTSDVNSVMNAGVLLGAFAAAAMAGKFSFQWRLPILHWIAALLGGVMLGYGATIAFGCNIGAYFGGIASGSLHGWLWLIAAFAGSIVGSYIRPLFKLDTKTSTRSAC
ncbi:YeeE/YedE family protein [Neptuniibacter sp.]|uniref:YeeE/YedE family protein n=1 Tax=Neptuniibacter sp. TaxID=1962643 RepID=UPI0026208708|nr:YeeE/YedE family protein [Neptuniibacter sp.]MCP4596722.1 YeeE/YedE family protein [Neptuniibacter sp.]